MTDPEPPPTDDRSDRLGDWTLTLLALSPALGVLLGVPVLLRLGTGALPFRVMFTGLAVGPVAFVLGVGFGALGRVPDRTVRAMLLFGGSLTVGSLLAYALFGCLLGCAA